MATDAAEVKSILTELERLLARFKLSDLKEIIVKKFSSFDWDELLLELQENRESLNSRTISRLFISKLVKQKCSLSEVQRLLYRFKVTDVSLNYTRRLWRAHKFQGERSEGMLTSTQLTQNIKLSCRDKALHIRAVAVQRGAFYWLMIQERKPPPKKKQKVPKSQYKSAVFLAISTSEPYLFAPPRCGLHEDIFECTALALNYTAVRAMPLTGHDVSEMLRGLRMSQGRTAGLARLAGHQFQPRVAVPLEGGGLDFTQRTERQRYVDEHFGEKPPLKPSIKFETNNKLTCNTLGDLDDLDFPMSVTFRSSKKDVWSMVKTLVVDEVIRFPTPAFYHQAMLRSQDVIKLKCASK